MTADAVVAISATPYRRIADGSCEGARSQNTARSHRPVLGRAVLRRVSGSGVRRETILDPVAGVIQSLAELAAHLLPGLGGKEQTHRAPDERAERERPEHAQGHVACRALLLQSDQAQHAVGGRETVAQLC